MAQPGLKRLLWAAVGFGATLSVLACAGGTAEEPAAPAPAVPAATAVGGAASAPSTQPQQPQAPAPAAAPQPAAQPSSPSAPSAASVPASVYQPRPGGAQAGGVQVNVASYYKAAPQPLGASWAYRDEYSPRPTKFSENPKFAALVRQGKLPPLEQRLPVPDDVYVFAPPDEIGAYGGEGRITSGAVVSRYLKFEALAGNGTCMQYDADGVNFYPLACKSAVVSPDGRVYTITLRRGLKWSDGVPFTMKDVEWIWSPDVHYNKELNPAVPGTMQDPITGNAVKFTKVDD
ncbi:MAG: hypothetical protein FJ319_04550 [SAR202 cluster bacterium]|nr:hypothetical protein [SAR202 cluster bacterium]